MVINEGMKSQSKNIRRLALALERKEVKIAKKTAETMGYVMKVCEVAGIPVAERNSISKIPDKNTVYVSCRNGRVQKVLRIS